LVLGERSVDGCGGLAQGCPPAPEHPLKQLAHIGQEVEAIGNLDGIGRALTRTVSVGAGTITADHVDAGVLSQPGRQTLGGSVRQEFDRLATFEVYEDRPVALAPPPGPVIDAEHTRIGWRPHRCLADQAEERRAAGRHPQTAPDAGTGAATEGEPDLAQCHQERHAATGSASCQSRYLLGEDTPRAPRRRTPEAAHAQMENDLAAGDRQISDPARVAAVHAVRMPSAAGAAGGTRGPVQIDLHGVVSDNDLLDVQAGEMGHGDRDAQGTPPAGSRSPERSSLQYYVSWSTCTENAPEPRPEYRKHLAVSLPGSVRAGRWY
jgi:hypothetical protein